MRGFYTAFLADALLRRVLTYGIVLYGADVFGRGTWAGLLYLCLVVPYLLSIYAGSLIDTMRRAAVLRATGVLTLLLMAGLAAAAHANTPHGAVVAAIVLGYGIVSAFTYPGFLASVADLVEPERLGRSTVMLNVLSLATQVASPILVGLLRAFASWTEFFAVAAALALARMVAQPFIRWTRANERPRRSSMAVALSPWTDIGEVHAYSRRHATLPTLLLAVLLFSTLVVGPLEVLVPLFASKTLALAPVAAGSFLAAGGIGLVIGALASLTLVGRARVGRWMCGAVFVGSAAIILMTITPRPVAFLLFFAGGINAGIFGSLSLAGVQEAATDHLRGRVVGIYTLVLGAPPAIGGAVSGMMSDALGTPAAIRIIFLILVTAFAALYATRPALRGAARSNPSGDGTPAPA